MVAYRQPVVVVYTHVPALARIITEACTEAGLHETRDGFVSVWDVANFLDTCLAGNSRNTVLVLDRGATDTLQQQTNWLATRVRSQHPAMKLVRIGSQKDFPVEPDAFWCKSDGFRLDSLVSAIEQVHFRG